MNTLIELYDERPLDNILATEVFRPERTVMLAPPELLADGQLIAGVRAFLKGRGIATRFEAAAVDVNDPLAVRGAIGEVHRQHPDCALDICGGTDAALFAGGLFASGCAVPVFTWSRKKQRFFDIMNAPFANVDTRYVRFGAEDFLRMAGGAMRTGRVDNAVLGRYMWLMEPFFSVFFNNRKGWVKTIGWLQTVSQAEKGNPDLDVAAPPEAKAMHERVRPDEKILRELADIGMIRGLSFGGERIRFSFADGQIRAWLRDVGSVLELYTYKACLDSELFFDVRTSVVVDWAGHQRQDGVSNEIDVLCSRGISPLFISCKTGEIKTEALNELAVLRGRFGGATSGALIVTAENANAAVRNRAAGLSIAVIDGQELAEGALSARLRALILQEA